MKTVGNLRGNKMGKVFRYPTAYYADGNTLYYKRRDADECISELREEIKILEEDVDYYKAEVKNAYVPGNALYQTIVRRVEPFFPKGTRDLEWDVLPGTIYKLAKENAQMKELLSEMSIDIENTLKDME